MNLARHIYNYSSAHKMIVSISDGMPRQLSWFHSTFKPSNLNAFIVIIDHAVNTLILKPNSYHFPDDTLKFVLLHLNCCIVFHALKTSAEHWFRNWLGAGQSTSHYRYHEWLYLMTYICVTHPRWVNQGSVASTYNATAEMRRMHVLSICDQSYMTVLWCWGSHSWHW